MEGDPISLKLSRTVQNRKVLLEIDSFYKINLCIRDWLEILALRLTTATTYVMD